MSSEVIANSIPVQEIEDIIEGIDYDIKKTKEIISNNTNININDQKNDYQIVRLRAMNTKSLDIKNRLQEIIEEEQEGKIQYVNENDKIEGEEEFYE